jgi:DNA invertase Pin-like site-specific DNA recombinase
MRGKFFSYLRVSTDKQGERGYGLDAQRKAIEDYLNGGSWELLGEFVEVESGKHNGRPKLAEALAACKKHRARLIIAKLDRLSRNVAFIATLMDGKVDFVCCDFPQANRLTLHILAAVAEHERDMISERTRAGLQAARERGVKLGGPMLPSHNAARQAEAAARARAIEPVISELAGLSAHATARELNRREVPTPTGKPWSAKTVLRVRERARGARRLNARGRRRARPGPSRILADWVRKATGGPHIEHAR